MVKTSYLRPAALIACRVTAYVETESLIVKHALGLIKLKAATTTQTLVFGHLKLWKVNNPTTKFTSICWLTMFTTPMTIPLYGLTLTGLSLCKQALTTPVKNTVVNSILLKRGCTGPLLTWWHRLKTH